MNLGSHFLILLVGAFALTCVACDTANLSPTPVAALQSEPSSTEVAIPSQGKVIVVNIRLFELIAFQDGGPVLRSRVIVGRPDSPTPELVSSMFAVQFNPAWTPTPSMVRNEGAHYLPPGPQNPLGRILFELDNDQLVFLHDTNERQLFNRRQRAISHGCIRVEKAGQLAAWVLGVSEQAIDKMVSQGSTYSIPLPEKIDVYLVRDTRSFDENPLVLHTDVKQSLREGPDGIWRPDGDGL